jgi:flavin-dependent dehydrogenase
MTDATALVVGGGPAGSVAATMLARAGVRVRLIDRARFPRPKLCGDTLNPGALALLRRFEEGERHDLVGALRVRALPLSGMTVTGPGDATVTADYGEGVEALSVSRSVLDLLLLERAAAAGVEIVEGVRAIAPVCDALRVTGVRVRRGEQRASCREEVWPAGLVIIADGRGSRLASALGLSRFARRPRRWAFGAYFAEVRGTRRRGEMHLRAGSYIGIAPLPGGLTNVCVVLQTDGQSRTAVDQGMIVERTVGCDPLLGDRFASARRVTLVTVLGPLAIESRTSGVPGALLAGDAAGFIDPMTGDGLRFAIEGAMLAAQAGVLELSSGQPAWRGLQQARRRAFAGKWRFNRILRLLAGSPQGVRFAARIADTWNWPVQQVIRFAGDGGVDGEVRRQRPDVAGALRSRA